MADDKHGELVKRLRDYIESHTHPESGSSPSEEASR